ncbi:MAG: hypothetical protein J6Q68_04730, partial [Clostridia bacterium]|nr:hypothetical protein [Clostridia bacterium]
VEYVNMFARCNIGFSYYPTKIGTPYPNMKGNMLGDVVRECHKRNIGVTAYLNTCLNHEQMISHSDWLLMWKNGKTYDFDQGGNAFRLMCYNSSYTDYYIAEIRKYSTRALTEFSAIASIFLLAIAKGVSAR